MLPVLISQKELWKKRGHLDITTHIAFKGLAEVLVQAVMSLHEDSKTKVRVGSETSEEFWVRVGVH